MPVDTEGRLISVRVNLWFSLCEMRISPWFVPSYQWRYVPGRSWGFRWAYFERKCRQDQCTCRNTALSCLRWMICICMRCSSISDEFHNIARQLDMGVKISATILRMWCRVFPLRPFLWCSSPAWGAWWNWVPGPGRTAPGPCRRWSAAGTPSLWCCATWDSQIWKKTRQCKFITTYILRTFYISVDKSPNYQNKILVVGIICNFFWSLVAWPNSGDQTCKKPG